jgi:hypothetical protein
MLSDTLKEAGCTEEQVRRAINISMSRSHVVVYFYRARLRVCDMADSKPKRQDISGTIEWEPITTKEKYQKLLNTLAQYNRVDVRDFHFQVLNRL